MTAFEKFLLKHRPLCEICTRPYPATQIIRDYRNKLLAVCDAHYRAHHPVETGLKLRGILEGPVR